MFPQAPYNYSYAEAVINFLWKTVKWETLCCCVSKYYCTSSTNLDKCSKGCCGRCLEVICEKDPSVSSESDSESLGTDLDSEFETTEKSSSDKGSDSSDQFGYLSS